MFKVRLQPGRKGAFKEKWVKGKLSLFKANKTRNSFQSEMLQELDVICGEHCKCYLVKDTINKWKLFLLAHTSKLASLFQFWASAQYCEMRKLHVSNVILFYFICSFRNQRRFIPNNNMFLFVLHPCLLHLWFLHSISLKEKRYWEEEGYEHFPSFMWRYLSPPVYEVLSQISFLSCVQRNFCQALICQFCRRFNSSNSEKSKKVSFMRVKCKGRRLYGVGAAWSDLESERKIAINEEASLLWRWELSSIKHQSIP